MKSDRRKAGRSESRSRRGLPRPAAWVTLVVIFLALVSLGFAKYQRIRLDRRFDDIARKQQSSSVDISLIRSELATMNLAHDALEREV
jgi:hypothetical protein